VSRTACTLRPVVVVVLAIRSTMTWWLVSGRPRQLRVIWENSRCSIWGEMQPESSGLLARRIGAAGYEGDGRWLRVTRAGVRRRDPAGW
jgi:hypothetical protein